MYIESYYIIPAYIYMYCIQNMHPVRNVLGLDVQHFSFGWLVQHVH